MCVSNLIDHYNSTVIAELDFSIITLKMILHVFIS